MYEKRQKKVKEFVQIFCFEMKLARGSFQIHLHSPWEIGIVLFKYKITKKTIALFFVTFVNLFFAGFGDAPSDRASCENMDFHVPKVS